MAQAPDHITSRQVKAEGYTLLADSESPIADVMFVHGLQGHPHNTWAYRFPSREGAVDRQKSSNSMGRKFSSVFGRPVKKNIVAECHDEETEVYWPLDLLAHDFANLRIFTYGYDSKVTNWFKGPAMHLDIYSYGESLLNGLEARRRADPERPLMFIVHSVGGLILKDVGICDNPKEDLLLTPRKGLT